MKPLKHLTIILLLITLFSQLLVSIAYAEIEIVRASGNFKDAQLAYDGDPKTHATMVKAWARYNYLQIDLKALVVVPNFSVKFEGASPGLFELQSAASKGRMGIVWSKYERGATAAFLRVKIPLGPEGEVFKISEIDLTESTSKEPLHIVKFGTTFVDSVSARIFVEYNKGAFTKFRLGAVPLASSFKRPWQSGYLKKIYPYSYEWNAINLVAGTDYKAKISAITEDGETFVIDWKDALKFTTKSERPESFRPTLQKTELKDTTTLNTVLIFTKPARLKIYVHDKSDTGMRPIFKAESAGYRKQSDEKFMGLYGHEIKHTYEIGGLDPGSDYLVTYVASSETGETYSVTGSKAVKIHTPGIAPMKLVKFQKDVTANSIKFTLKTTPETNVMFTFGGSGLPLKYTNSIVFKSDHEFEFTKLKPATPYHYTIFITDRRGFNRSIKKTEIRTQALP